MARVLSTKSWDTLILRQIIRREREQGTRNE